MGEQFLTLADIWPARVRVAIVGLNPAPRSVAAGHYYQGSRGRAQMNRLGAAGLFQPSADGYFEDVGVAAGVGFTDLVKRPTAAATAVSQAELRHGRGRLETSLRKRQVPLIICIFKDPVVALLGATSGPGFQATRTPWGARVFRLPGPSQERESAAAVMAQLTRALSG